jgi:hypothetical protein
MTKAFLVLGLFCASSVLAGCGDADDPPLNPIEEQGELEIKGTWDSSFGGVDTITDDTWLEEGGEGDTAYTFEQLIVSYLNDENELVTEVAGMDGASPTYSRTVWTEIDGDSFYFCTTDFLLSSAAAAEARNTVPDDSDPDNSGCGDFSWTKLTRQ